MGIHGPSTIFFDKEDSNGTDGAGGLWNYTYRRLQKENTTGNPMKSAEKDSEKEREIYSFRGARGGVSQSTTVIRKKNEENGLLTA